VEFPYIYCDRGQETKRIKLLQIVTDQYSFAAKPLELSFQGKSLSSGTGFIWRAEGKAFLITNWHIVTGIDPRTGRHLANHGGEPDTVSVQFDPVGAPFGMGRPIPLPLRDAEGVPLWLEHSAVRGIDVVALPLPEMPDVALYPINEMDDDPMLVAIGTDAFILGYPFGNAASTFPIWKRASIASEPHVSIDGQPCFYVDTASRPGMSGSPVILRSWGGFQTDKGGMVAGPGAATRFIGVYSGRIVAKDQLQAQLGVVWRAEVVDRIITTGCPGSMTAQVATWPHSA